MAAAVVARSLLRSASTSVRASAPEISGCTRSFRSRKPLSHRIFRLRLSHSFFSYFFITFNFPSVSAILNFHI
ncbi:hypothetical protein Hanom_Chr01g00046531 [Helianthus anomalus]